MNQDQPKADESREARALRAACHDMAKMEAGIFGMPVDPGREDKLYGYYLEKRGENPHDKAHHPK